MREVITNISFYTCLTDILGSLLQSRTASVSEQYTFLRIVLKKGKAAYVQQRFNIAKGKTF